jgi:hypothetical protein
MPESTYSELKAHIAAFSASGRTASDLDACVAAVVPTVQRMCGRKRAAAVERQLRSGNLDVATKLLIAQEFISWPAVYILIGIAILGAVILNLYLYLE